MNPIKHSSMLMVIFLLFPAIFSFSQDNQEKPFQEKGTIESQFDFTFEKSYTFENFKSIRIPWFLTLKSHVLDTIKTLKKELKKTQMLVKSKETQVDSLNTELSKTNDNLTTITKEKNSFRLLGILMDKKAYNSFLWTSLLILAVGLLGFIILFKRSNAITNQSKTTLAEVKEEFEVFRKRSLEREEKMARKHLDELNKYKK